MGGYWEERSLNCRDRRSLATSRRSVLTISILRTVREAGPYNELLKRLDKSKFEYTFPSWERTGTETLSGSGEFCFMYNSVELGLPEFAAPQVHIQICFLDNRGGICYNEPAEK